MRAQFVDRGEAHHAFRHLGLDRTVRIERIGHAVDDARLQHRHRRLIAIARRAAIGLRPRRRPSAAPLRRNVARPPSLRLGPGIVERRGRRLGRFGQRGCICRVRTNIRRQHIRRQRLAGSRLRAFALFARGRGKQQIALGLGRCSGLGRFGLRRAIARAGLVLPRGRSRRDWRFRIRGCRIVAAEQHAAIAGRGFPRCTRRQHRPHRDSPARLRHSGAEPARDVFQLPDRHPEREHDRAGTNRHHAGENQRIAETEFLDRDSKADRQQARQNKAYSGNQHDNHHRTHPRRCARNARSPLLPRYRHIVCIANRQLCTEFRKTSLSALKIPACRGAADLIIQLAFRPAVVFLPPTNCCPFAALHQGN